MTTNKWDVIKFSLNCFYIEKVFQFYRNFRIEPILIKGYSIARYYPEQINRDFLDIDLAFSDTDYQRAKSLSVSDELSSFPIDFHNELRHLDTLPWQNLFGNSQIIKLKDTDVRVLCPEDHLRVLCVHWLTHGGEDRDRLWDIFYLVKNRPPDFDWDRCLNTVSDRRRRWIVCTIGLAQKYLELDLTGTPIEEEARNLPNWFVRRIQKEWKSDVRLIPLRSARTNFKSFTQQIIKRLPPNPITATILCEGDFDSSTRIFYQIRNIFERLKSRKTDI